VTASAGKQPGEQIVACTQLCTGSASNEYFSFGPVYKFTDKGETAFRIANFHVWFTLDGNGTVALDYSQLALYNQSGVTQDYVGPWTNPACLPYFPPGQDGSGGGSYNLVNHAILSLPKDMCFGFKGSAPVTATTFAFITNVNLTPAS
jgi:hypothetical protein